MLKPKVDKQLKEAEKYRKITKKLKAGWELATYY
jgi:hypothetical protein